MSSRTRRPPSMLNSFPFDEGDFSYQFLFDKDMTAHISISHKEKRENKIVVVQDFISITKVTINNEWMFKQQHSWLSENFRQHLLKFMKLPAFF